MCHKTDSKQTVSCIGLVIAICRQRTLLFTVLQKQMHCQIIKRLTLHFAFCFILFILEMCSIY